MAGGQDSSPSRAIAAHRAFQQSPLPHLPHLLHLPHLPLLLATRCCHLALPKGSQPLALLAALTTILRCDRCEVIRPVVLASVPPEPTQQHSCLRYPYYISKLARVPSQLRLPWADP